jgi:hypothetical protein
MNWEAALQDCDELDAKRRRRIGRARSCRPEAFPLANRKKGRPHGKVDLDSLGIEELAALREQATEKLFENSVVL